jgi:phospholipid transport system substrate-binding protein
MKFFHTLVIILALAVGFSASAYADATSGPSEFIQGVGDKALAVISDKGLSKDQKQDKLNKLFSDIVDFPWVGRFVMGHYWREATPEQKSRYLAEYKKFLLVHYTSRFTNFTSGSFQVMGVKDDGDGEYTVTMRMKADDPGSEPIQVDYRVHSDDVSGAGHFKIFDVIVEGVGLLNTQRSEFSSVIANNGIDYLIDQLATKSKSGDI